MSYLMINNNAIPQSLTISCFLLIKTIKYELSKGHSTPQNKRPPKRQFLDLIFRNPSSRLQTHRFRANRRPAQLIAQPKAQRNLKYCQEQIFSQDFPPSHDHSSPGHQQTVRKLPRSGEEALRIAVDVPVNNRYVFIGHSCEGSEEESDCSREEGQVNAIAAHRLNFYVLTCIFCEFSIVKNKLQIFVRSFKVKKSIKVQLIFGDTKVESRTAIEDFSLVQRVITFYFPFMFFMIFL